LRGAADACDRTLVAKDATVSCARGELTGAGAAQAFFDRRDALWAGADLTGVVPLPDGRKLWLFGDTLYSDVDTDGGRGPLVGFGNNSAFVQSGGCMRHVAGSAAQRSWLVPPQGDGSAYWPGGGVVVGDRLHVFLGRVLPEPPFGRLLDRAVATLTLPDLRLVGITPLPLSNTGPGFGSSAVAPGDGFVYVYGTRRPDCDRCYASDIYVARVPAGSVTDTSAWAFWDGGAWAADANAARPVMSGGGAQVDVQPWRGGWLAVSKAADILSPDIVGWWAPGPSGPWSPLGTLYRVPAVASPAKDTYTYMPSVVARRADGRLLLAYNVGTFSDATSRRDAALYGPRFVEVDVPFVAGMR
jgi:hypothetical protein